MAITGLGVVSAFGLGTSAFWAALCSGRSGTGPITLVDPSLLTASAGAEVPGFDPLAHFPEDRLPLFDRHCQFAMVAAREAWRHAGLDAVGEAAFQVGVAMGTGMGSAATYDREYRRLYELRGRMHPFTIPALMHNAAASNVAMDLGLRGPTLAMSTACAAGAHAIGEAAEMIRAGRADAMVAGGADAPFSLGSIKCWEAMRVLAPADGDPASACRPFSRNRKGMVLGEGAAAVVLEAWEPAQARGAVILGELAGYGATADAAHITQPGVEAPAQAILAALRQAGLGPGDVDHVNAHGTGTRLNDATETTILKRVFGGHAPALSIAATKSMHGHAIGASGALELVALTLALRDGVVPPTINLTEADAECDLDYTPNVARRRAMSAGISNTFAFGGLNAVLAVRAAG